MRLYRILLAPGDGIFGGGGGSTAPPVAPAAPAASPAPAPEPSPATIPMNRDQVGSPATNVGDRNFELPDNYGQPAGSPAQPNAAPRQAAPTPTDPNAAAGAATGQNAWQSIREAAGEFGYSFGADVTDDRMALQRLVHAAQANTQATLNAQLGQRLAPHVQDFQAFLQQRQQQAAAPTARPAWEAPPFDRRWATLVTQDQQTGIYLSNPGVDPAIGKAVNEYADWKQKYDENPAAVLNQMVKAQATDIATQVYQQQFGEQQQRQAAQNIVAANSSWFYAKGADGRPILDYQNRPQPSPAGTVYLRHLQAVRQAGVTDPVMQDSFAQQLMRGEYAANNARQTQQQQVAAAPPAQFQAQQVNTNPLQALPLGQQAITQGVVRSGTEGLSLTEQLARAFTAGNVTDADFSPENF